LGGYLGLEKIIPFFDKFRSYQQFMVSTLLFISVISGWGLENLTKVRRSFNLRLSQLLGLLYIAMFIVTVVVGNLNILPIPVSNVLAISFLSLFSVYLYTSYTSKVVLLLIIGVSFIEIFSYFNQTGFYHLQSTYGKIFRQNMLLIEYPGINNLFRYSFDQDQFAYNTSILKVFSTVGYETLPTKSIYNIYFIDPVKANKYLNVKYIVTTSTQNIPSYKLVRTVGPKALNEPDHLLSSVPGSPYWDVTSLNTHYIYELQGFNSRYFIPNRLLICTIDCYKSIDITQDAFISSGTEFQNPSGQSVKITINQYTPNIIKMDINTPAQVFISSSEVYDSGWKIKVNDKNEQLFNINGGFRGFYVPAGNSKVIMYYTVPWFKVGLAFSLLGTVTFVILMRFSNRNQSLRKI
jgi:hypothetical protein